MNFDDVLKRVRDWSQGRLGPDDLTVFSLVVTALLLIINLFARQVWLGWLVVVPLAYALWRMSSKDLSRRARENERFLGLIGPVRPWLQNPKAALEESRRYRHVACASCGQRIRLPRGKGRLRVTCPRCHEKFETRS